MRKGIAEPTRQEFGRKPNGVDIRNVFAVVGDDVEHAPWCRGRRPYTPTSLGVSDGYVQRARGIFVYLFVKSGIGARCDSPHVRHSRTDGIRFLYHCIYCGKRMIVSMAVL